MNKIERAMLDKLDLENKQETNLEEVAEQSLRQKFGTYINETAALIWKQGFKVGYKEQQKRSYSKMDLEVAFFEGRENSLTFIEWFEQFKK